MAHSNGQASGRTDESVNDVDEILTNILRIIACRKRN